MPERMSPAAPHVPSARGLPRWLFIAEKVATTIIGVVWLLGAVIYFPSLARYFGYPAALFMALAVPYVGLFTVHQLRSTGDTTRTVSGCVWVCFAVGMMGGATLFTLQFVLMMISGLPGGSGIVPGAVSFAIVSVEWVFVALFGYGDVLLLMQGGRALRLLLARSR